MAANPIPELSDTDKARFWAKVDVRGPDDCWPWAAHRNERGYGQFWAGSGMHRAHRVALAIDGRNPRDLHGRHKCDNPACCNPAHLEVGTHTENMRDMHERGRFAPALGPRNGHYTKPERTPRGEANGCARLTDDAVRGIRADTRSHRVIALDYGISSPQISRIKRREAWGHVQ